MTTDPYRIKRIERLEKLPVGVLQAELARLKEELAAIGGPITDRSKATKEQLMRVSQYIGPIKDYELALSAHRWQVREQAKPQQQDEPALPGWLSAEARQQAWREMEALGIKSPEEWVKRNSLRNSLYEALPDLPENQ